MATKEQSDSARSKRGATAQANLAHALSGEPVFPYPPGLPSSHQDIWRDTVNTKTGSYWSLGDVPILKLYCRVATDIERLTSEIDEEGEIIHNANGNPIVNPKIVVRGFAEARLMTLCTKLRLQPSSRMDTKGEDSELNKKGKAKRAAKTIEEDSDDLLASGNMSMQ